MENWIMLVPIAAQRMVQMKIQNRQTDSGATIVELEGMLVMGHESERVESTVEKLAKEGKKKIIVDLAKVSYVDSSGIGVLVGSLGHCKRAGGEMRLAGVQDNILRIMRIAHVDQVLPVDASLEEAEKKMGGA
jgi:anti-sigma B factor antagonist